LPLLVRQGFRGPIYCTPATKDLAAVILRDAAHLQEEEAEIANRYGFSKHSPALPLYTTEDAEAALGLLESRGYGAPFPVTDDVDAIYRRAGHILGAATIELQLGPGTRTRLVFSGDLGRWNRPILRDPELVPEADVVLVESTYGDRVHSGDPKLHWRVWCATRSLVAVRSSFPHSRSDACRISSGPCGGSKTRTRFRRCPSSSTARWRST
jgi:metallo-beta-lactamase family protein